MTLKKRKTLLLKPVNKIQIMKRYMLILFLASSPCLLWGQGEKPICQNMIREGNRELAAENPNLDAALKAYLNALNCDSKLAGTVGPLIDSVFTLIQAQKQEAQDNLNLAERRRLEAEAKTREAQALSIATRANFLPREEMETALLLARAAYRKNEPASPPADLSRTLSDRFYDQMANEMEPARPFYTSRLAHQTSIRKVWITPDDESILTYTEDSVFHLWDRSGKIETRLPGNNANVYFERSRFSPDSKFLLIGFTDSTLLLLDLKNHRRIDLGKQNGFIMFADFTPDSKYVYINIGGSGKERNGIIFDMEGHRKMDWEEKLGHTILANRFAPNELYFLSRFDDGYYYLHEVLKDTKISVYRDTTSGYTAGVISPTGQFILIRNADGTGKLWHRDTQETKNLDGKIELNRFYKAGFSSDENYLLINDAKLWDIKESRLVSDLEEKHFTPLRFIEGSKWLFGHTEKGSPAGDNMVGIWDIVKDTLKETVGFAGFDKDVQVFSSNARYLLNFAGGDKITLWDVGYGREMFSAGGFTSKVKLAFFSPDDSAILTQMENGVINLWNLSGKKLLEIQGFYQYSKRPDFTRDGLFIVGQADKTTAKIWPVSGALFPFGEAAFSPGGQFYWTRGKLFTSQGNFVASYSGILAISKDDHVVMLQGQDQVKIFDQRGTLISEWALPPNTRVDFAPDQQRILTFSSPGGSVLWNIRGDSLAGWPHQAYFLSKEGYTFIMVQDNEQKEVRLFDLNLRPKGTLKGLQYVRPGDLFLSPNGQYVMMRRDGPTSRAFHLQRWNINGERTDSISNVTSYPAFSGDGNCFFVKMNDKPTVFNHSGKALISFPDHSRPLFSPDNQSMVSVTRAGDSILLYDLKSKRMTLLDQPEEPVVGYPRFSNNGQYLLLDFKKKAVLWRLAGRRSFELDEHTGNINSLAFSPDDRYIVSSSDDKTAKIWNTLNGKVVATLAGHEGRVQSASFSPDSKYIVTGSYDKTAKMWNLKGELLADLNRFSETNIEYIIAHFNPNGQFIKTSNRINDNGARSGGSTAYWPVPARIYHYLSKESAIRELTKEEKEKFRVE